MDQAEYDAALAEIEAHSAKVLREECPKCGGHMPGTPDQRQAGPTQVKGTWYKHRCESCGYWCDLVHPDVEGLN